MPHTLTLPLSAQQLSTRILFAAFEEITLKHQVTYDEYEVLKWWMIQVGENGEWPLWLDVFYEHVVEKANYDRKGYTGTQGSIEGP